MQTSDKTRKFRHELKYYMNYADYLTIRSRLMQIAAFDSHADEDGKYLIRSLYFETPTDTALQEKLTGIMEREKFRIRFYNHDTSFIRLEKKMKINTMTRKISCPVTRVEVERLLSGDIEWMKTSERALLIELYAKMQYQQLRPKTIVDYTRECFIYAPVNVRFTLDTDIRSGLSATEIFSDKPVVHTNSEPVIIMEVKYDNFLPSIIKALVQLPNRRVTAFSKYAAARILG